MVVFVLVTNKSEAPVVPEPSGNGGGTQVIEKARKGDLIVVDSPLPNSVITSPLVIKGRARGNWFFEATFPVVLTNWDGLIIAEGYAQADGEWMTTEYVPFTATLNFTKPADANVRPQGILILQKSNASGLPEHDDALEYWIKFQ